jgi:hypothetical protein
MFHLPENFLDELAGYQVEPNDHFFRSLSKPVVVFHLWNSSTELAEAPKLCSNNTD